MEDYLPIPQISHMPFIFQNNAKCTYFQPKIYLRVPKMYLVNNVLENQIWAVPLLNNYKIDSECSIYLFPNAHDSNNWTVQNKTADWPQSIIQIDELNYKSEAL